MMLKNNGNTNISLILFYNLFILKYVYYCYCQEEIKWQKKLKENDEFLCLVIIMLMIFVTLNF